MLLDVKSEATKFLRDCGIAKPPTDFHSLLSARQLGLSLFEEPPEHELPEHLRGTIRAIIDIPDKQIFVSKTLHKKKRRFASFHELAHDVLPWHNDIFRHRCSELDLSAAARKHFDIEANAFAAECLFQGDRFNKEALESSFRMSAVLSLADQYEVSYEAALRRYVERHPDACALLVFESIHKKLQFGAQSLRIKYLIRNPTFPWIEYEKGLAMPAASIVNTICSQHPDKPVRSNITLFTKNANEIRCRGYLFFTGYTALLLLRPRNFQGTGELIPLQASQIN